MKKILILLGIFLPAFAGAQTSLWFFQGGTLQPNSSTWTITVPGINSTGSTRCLQITSGGLFQVASAGCSSGGGGGGSGWTFIPGAIYNSTTTDQILLGAIATTSTAKLEVIGNGYFSGGSTPILGLGTTTSKSEFAVQGGGLFSGNLSMAGITATGTATFGGNTTFNGAFTLNSTFTANFFSPTSSVTYCTGLSGTRRFAGCNGTGILGAYLYSPKGNGTIDATSTGFFSNVFATGTLSVEGNSLMTGTLSVASGVFASSTLQTTSTTTLYSDLVFNPSVNSRPLYVLFSGDNSGSRGIRFATTTANINGQWPVFVITSTTTGTGDYSRVAIGTTTLGAAGLRSPFTVDGDIYSTRRQLNCDYPGMMVQAAIGTSNNFICGFALRGTNGGIFASNFEYPSYLRLRSQPASPALGQANAVGDGSGLFGFGGVSASSSPVFEAVVSNPSYFATNTIERVGFASTTGALSTANFNLMNREPSDGAWFEANATSSNWIAVAKNNNTNTTRFNTGVATSSTPTNGSNPQRLRIEISGSTTATFLINGNIVAIANTTTPAGWLPMYPFISFGSVGAAAYAPNNGVPDERSLNIYQFRLSSDF